MDSALALAGTAPATARTILAGEVREPVGGSGGYTTLPASGSLIYASTPGEEIYLGPGGGAIATTADGEGRYKLGVAPGKPILVSAVLAGNRRLVGLAYPTATGTATADISLESTYVTEFLRTYAARAGKPLSSLDIGQLPAAVGSARSMLEAGQLDPAPDLAPGAIPDLVAGYLAAMAAHRKDVSDFWAQLLGIRPLAITTLEDSAEAGYLPTAIVVDPARGHEFVASFNATGVAIRRTGRGDPVFRALAADGFLQVTAFGAGPDGRLYFAERVDRGLGGAVDRAGTEPQIRMFRFDPGTIGQQGQAAIEELRLQAPREIAAYLADTEVASHVEPSSLAWHGGKLYLGDLAASLIYEFTPPADLSTGSVWQGQVFAGRVTGGRPDRGSSTGPRREGAAFDGVVGLLWHGGDLLFSDTENSVVRAIDAAGMVRNVAGRPGKRGNDGDGAQPLDATFSYPQGLAADATGRLFIADGDNHRIRAVIDGRMRTVAGGGTRARDGDSLDVAIGQVTALAFDLRGNLLFNDLETAKVRRLWLQNGL
jgi:hypothetical protein